MKIQGQGASALTGLSSSWSRAACLPGPLKRALRRDPLAVRYPGMPLADDTALPRDDADMEAGDRARRGDYVRPQGGSPPKSRRSESDLAISADLLKNLLAEQQEAILAAQKLAIKETVESAIGQLEKRQDARFSKMEDRATSHDDRMTKLEEHLKLIQGKVQDLEAGSTAPPSSSGSGDKDFRNRNTLVIGGFPRDSRRSLILQQIEKVLDGCDLRQHVDSSPFTTRPRSSFALLKFVMRDREGMDQTRSRMYLVMNEIIRSRTHIPGQDRPMWAGVSKTKQEREKAQYCGIVRDVVRYFNVDLLEKTDNDYGTGTSWVGESLVSSATDAAPAGREHVFFFDSKPHKGWVDFGALSSELQADRDEILDYLKNKTR